MKPNYTTRFSTKKNDVEFKKSENGLSFSAQFVLFHFACSHYFLQPYSKKKSHREYLQLTRHPHFPHDFLNKELKIIPSEVYDSNKTLSKLARKNISKIGLAKIPSSLTVEKYYHSLLEVTIEHEDAEAINAFLENAGGHPTEQMFEQIETLRKEMTSVALRKQIPLRYHQAEDEYEDEHYHPPRKRQKTADQTAGESVFSITSTLHTAAQIVSSTPISVSNAIEQAIKKPSFSAQFVLFHFACRHYFPKKDAGELSSDEGYTSLADYTDLSKAFLRQELQTKTASLEACYTKEQLSKLTLKYITESFKLIPRHCAIKKYYDTLFESAKSEDAEAINAFLENAGGHPTEQMFEVAEALRKLAVRKKISQCTEIATADHGAEDAAITSSSTTDDTLQHTHPHAEELTCHGRTGENISSTTHTDLLIFNSDASTSEMLVDFSKPYVDEDFDESCNARHTPPILSPLRFEDDDPDAAQLSLCTDSEGAHLRFMSETARLQSSIYFGSPRSQQPKDSIEDLYKECQPESYTNTT